MECYDSYNMVEHCIAIKCTFLCKNAISVNSE